jgi:hypothetical protein
LFTKRQRLESASDVHYFHLTFSSQSSMLIGKVTVTVWSGDEIRVEIREVQSLQKQLPYNDDRQDAMRERHAYIVSSLVIQDVPKIMPGFQAPLAYERN